MSISIALGQDWHTRQDFLFIPRKSSWPQNMLKSCLQFAMHQFGRKWRNYSASEGQFLTGVCATQYIPKATVFARSCWPNFHRFLNSQLITHLNNSLCEFISIGMYNIGMYLVESGGTILHQKDSFWQEFAQHNIYPRLQFLLDPVGQTFTGSWIHN